MLQSFLDAANDPEGEFPLANLPYGVFSRGGGPRCGVAIGDRIVDVALLAADGDLPHADALLAPSWNAFMALGPVAWAQFREALTERLSADAAADRAATEAALVPLEGSRLHLPFAVAEYTDFYSGRQHAANVGVMLRGAENALPPNWLSLPIAYNGRASTVVVSGTEIRRPLGQTKPKDATEPVFGPSRRLDFELELGAVVGTPSRMGEPVSVAAAAEMIFGFVLLNDWSARDIQAWEYQPLGPFQAKAFATTVSPWIVSRAALAPFRVPAPPRERALLPYLAEDAAGLYDIALEVELAPAGGPATVISRTNARELYYSAAQQLAHHTSSGCAMRTGDLLGSGTISGPQRDAFGSLLELAWGGQNPVALDGGAVRSFVEDGDTVTLRGRACGDGYRIGFGACSGTILPSPRYP